LANCLPDGLRSHHLVHLAHCLGRGAHGLAEGDIGAHVLVLVANGLDLPGGCVGSGLLLPDLHQLLGQNAAGIVVARGGISSDLQLQLALLLLHFPPLSFDVPGGLAQGSIVLPLLLLHGGLLSEQIIEHFGILCDFRPSFSTSSDVVMGFPDDESPGDWIGAI